MKTAWFCGLWLGLAVSSMAWTRAAADQPSAAAAGTLRRDFGRCRARADIDACYDAIRYNPNDPALLVALGDALQRANRPADALRNYRRAAALAPNMKVLPIKIAAAESKLHPKRSPISRHADSMPVAAVPGRYSNAAPEAQSH